MSDRYIFTTRLLGNGMAFSRKTSLNEDSPIRLYLQGHFSESNDDIWIWFKSYYQSLSEDIKTDFKKEYVVDPSYFIGEEDAYKSAFKSWYLGLSDKEKGAFLKRLVDSKVTTPKITAEIAFCPGEDDSEKIDARFCFFSLNSSDENVDVDAYAIPHLGWKSDIKWIKALIEEPFEKQFDEGCIHLVLHDDDLPGYDKTPYLVLTAEEVCCVFYPEMGEVDREEHIKKNDDGRDVFYYDNKRTVQITVFQHSWNDAIGILKNKSITPIEIHDSLDVNAEIVKAIFESSSSDSRDRMFRSLNEKASVDICHFEIDKSLLSKEKDLCFIYEDNGALLTEFMHVKTDLQGSKQIIRFIGMLRDPAFDVEHKLVSIRKMLFPIIIVVRPFFEDWLKARPEKTDEIMIHKNKRALEENLRHMFSFFNNSSIWVRLVKNEDEKERAIREFTYFNRIGLYSYDSAWENLEYTTRIFAENYLLSSVGGHGRFVTPVLYGNETKALETMRQVFDGDA